MAKSLFRRLPLPEMVSLDGGSFLMGCDSGRDDEAPSHVVELSGFSIARFATTNREYADFLRETGAVPPSVWEDSRFNHPEQPIVAVNWFEAVSYCVWLSGVTGEPFRLPTEAEREFACRAGSVATFPWGESADRELGEYGRRWLEGGPETVGGPPNAFGLCNMADNVHEWCSDWYDREYYKTSPGKNPPGPASGVRRASRGGSWRHHLKVTRSSARSALDPALRYTDFGFRVARAA